MGPEGDAKERSKEMNGKRIAVGTVAVAALVAIVMHGIASDEKKDVSSKTAESSVVTNDNGSVSRSFTECTVTTNGSMVIEHRRETRTNMDAEGNMLETSTSEYTQSYPVGDSPMAVSSFGGGTQDALMLPAVKKGDKPAVNSDSFLGLKFGDVFESDKFERDADNRHLLRAAFTPKKPLADFDDYYVYVTPTTHRVAMVYACAKKAVDPGLRPRRHYLVEALEKKYNTWARLRSYWLPLYELDIGSDRHVRICLSGATENYETVIAAWDNTIGAIAMDEYEAIRDAERKAAADRRAKRVSDAQDAF